MDARGERCNQIQQIGLYLGDSKVEQRCPGMTLVGSSRPETANDFCYLSPVGVARLAASSQNKQLAAQRAFAERYDRDDEDSPAGLLLPYYDELVRWAIDYAKSTHGIVAPWPATGTA